MLQKCYFQKHFGVLILFFFCHDLYECHFWMKFCKHWEFLSLFPPKKFRIFWNVFHFFWFYCSSRAQMSSGAQDDFWHRSSDEPTLRWVGAHAPTKNLKVQYYWLVFFKKCAKIFWILKEYALTQILCPQSKYSLGPPLHRRQVLGHGHIKINMQYKPFYMPLSKKYHHVWEEITVVVDLIVYVVTYP